MNWMKGHSGRDRVLLVLYYLAVVVALILMYGRGDFSTPPFVYQGF
jgi:D-Ala-teichoic acid biosynthesis protein.